jgi:hypothetical protein
MARIFDIIPVGATEIQHLPDGGSVQRDLDVMYDIGEDAEEAFDLIVKPFGQVGGFYLDNIRFEGLPAPWAFVALRREYDISTYVRTQRDQIDAKGESGFKFTPYDFAYDERRRARETASENVGPPKVGCLIFFSKNSVAAAAERIRFLRPAWTLLQDKAVYRKWLVLLDEEERGHILRNVRGAAPQRKRT